MSVTDVPVDRLDALETRSTVLTDQMAVLAADAEHRRRQRESFEDLTGDLARVSEDAMVMATRELESLSQTADLGRHAPTPPPPGRGGTDARTCARRPDSASSFVDDASHRSGPT